MRAVCRSEAIAQLKTTPREQRIEKLFQLWPERVDAVFHFYFLTVFFTGAFEFAGATAFAWAFETGAGDNSGFAFGIILLITSCCRIMATFEINQYSTSPEDA